MGEFRIPARDQTGGFAACVAAAAEAQDRMASQSMGEPSFADISRVNRWAKRNAAPFQLDPRESA